jgi:hypothetical protein
MGCELNRSLEVKKDGVPVLARKQSFLSLSSRCHQRVLSAKKRTCKSLDRAHNDDFVISYLSAPGNDAYEVTFCF